MIDTSSVIEMFNTLPEDKRAEVFDFIKFLKYQMAKDRILESDKESRLAFQSIDDLMDAIDNAD